MNRALPWLAAVLLTMWVGLVFLTGWAEARVFSGSPVDGPFQLLDALRRLHAGQHAGSDFPAFHGVGVAWLHYPFFALLGANLWASELTRQWLSPLLYLVSLITFAWAATSGNVRRVVIFTALGVMLCYPLALVELYTPANSLLGVRSTLPIFFFALLASRASRAWKIGLGGLLVALSWICGADQGLMLAVACVLVCALLLLRGHSEGWTIAWALLTGIAATVPILALITGGNVMPALRFAFVELPKDQFWFFGAPPNAMPVDLWSLRLIGERGLLVIAVAGIVWLSMVWSAWNRRLQSPVMLLMLTAGLLSCSSYLGLLSAHYYAPLGRILLMVILWKAVTAQRQAWLAGLTVLAVLLGPMSVWQDFAKKKDKLAQNGPVVSGSILSPDWAAHMEQIESLVGPLAGRGNDLPLWSTYRGLPEAVSGAILPGEDYLIHALGDQRREAYYDRFRQTKPAFVVTIRADRMAYEEWLRNSTWPFYRELLEHYDIAGQTPMALVWQRRPDGEEGVGPARPLTVLNNTLSLKPLHGDQPEVYTVELEYQTLAPLQRLPLISLLPRYLVELEGTVNTTAVSLPPAPNGGHFEFGVLPKSGVHPRLTARARSLIPGASVTIKSASIRIAPLRSGQTLFATVEHN